MRHHIPDVGVGRRFWAGGKSALGRSVEICFSRPEFTSQWLMELPAGTFQASAAGTLAKAWSRFDPEAADAWARALPEGSTKEAALKALGAPAGR